jgi:hypothetical protein
MLFHVGSLWRLNEIGTLGTLKRISSVSGGSITAAVLGMNWMSLGISSAAPTATLELFMKFFVSPLREMAATTVDEGAILGGILRRFGRDTIQSSSAMAEPGSKPNLIPARIGHAMRTVFLTSSIARFVLSE